MNTTQADTYGLVVTLPATLDGGELTRLHALIDAKADLITTSLHASRLDITITDEGLSFPWWDHLPDFETITAYTEFLTKLVAYAKRIRRTVPRRPKSVVNEKYEMRAFFYRLGLGGSEYKQVRKVLLTPLSGHSAWKEPKK
ncbi:virulence protein [Trueperella pecoris]|uniref:Virulence protein n=1 Tax=Trueperella pecoris TaxID=2733571 RepID=A0A7M1QWV2_9ACTO|nr:virulence protein [Trueperella pecoris]QOR45825.1 virulence protein [Trueperella pecoris]QOR47920.1 virulence protein [Trueperella pecoris]QTG75653.1 virulence protein [Trueperella pecoris]